MKKYIHILVFQMIVFFGYAQSPKANSNATDKKKSETSARLAIDDGGGGGCTYCYEWNIDRDRDGFGDPSMYVFSDTQPIGYVADQSDCDDYQATITTFTWYYDGDGDGFGDLQNPVFACTQPLQYVSNSTDCNDLDVAINANTIWFTDLNGDGIYSESDGTSISSCASPGPNYSIGKDNNYHWIHGVSYDIKGNVTSASRSYFDDLGKSDVSLSKDFVQNRVWGTETTFDEFGRPDKSSFIAPSPFTSFEKTNFFKTTAQTQAGDYPTNQSIINPITTSQDIKASGIIIVSSAVSPGLTVSLTANNITLSPGFNVSATTGSSFKASAVSLPDTSTNPNLTNYYSDSNTYESYQATATHPFSQNNYDKLNPGNVINVVGGNRIAGEWKTGYSYTVPAAQEMYYVYGSDYYDGPVASGREEVISKFYKSVSVDANGVENIAFSDGEGKILATARSGGITSYPVISLIGTQGFVDVHIPAGITSGISLIGGASLKVYDLKTGLITTSLTGGNAYRIQAITPPTTDPKTYISGGIPTNDNGVLGITYNVNYYDYAINVYNKTGQLIKSIQPNGYVANSAIVAVPAHMTSTNFASTYVYNALGQVIQASSPDEGTSKFAYRKDGQIRYSQSALQSDTKVSYTDYDTYGRPIESGVINTSPTKIWPIGGPDPDTTLLGTLAQRSEQTFTIYDDASNNVTSVPLPASLTLSSVLTSAGISTTNYTQNNLSGNVAITYTKPAAAITAITWYSYDIYGRSEWMVQYNEGIGAKTINYEYDYKGNVKKVIYQKNKASELFAHQYTYDANNVLQQVQTATNLVSPNFITHADYKYYLTGELKRVNLVQAAQGLDYVYTLGGALKSINHPSLEQLKDPGQDPNTSQGTNGDLFGITLDYYNGDYLRNGRNITTSSNVAGANQDFNGNIKAARWANKSTSMDLSGSTVNQKGYLYNYDRNNFLTDAVFGNTVNAANATITPTTNYKEGALTYDPNGNIKSLQRTNNAGTTVDNLTYNYTNTGKNQLNSLTESAAVTSDLTDIETQAAGNYVYDAIGQMTRNNQEDINYFYNTQGLVTQVNKGANPAVRFFYNERGQRIKKESFNGSGNLSGTSYYILDLSGNVMSNYYNPVSSTIFTQIELPIYGLSRLGVYVKGTSPNLDFMNYQITDHLGNVRAVVNKPVIGTATMNSYADYYPFGEQLPGRNSMSNYRYAFQGQELDGETGMEAFELRLWDGRIGRWLSPDPYGQHSSPYAGMGNNPVSHIDPDGGWEWKISAMWHAFWGGGTAFQSERGDWGVQKDAISNADGVTIFSPNFGGTRYDNNGTSSSLSWQYKDPFPNSKWDWFQNRQSGSFSFGSAPNNGSERDYGGKVGKYGTRYPTTDDEMVTGGGGGGKLTFWKHEANYVPKIVKFVKDYNDATQKGSQLGDNLGIKKDTFFTVSFTYKRNEHQFSIMGLKGNKQVDSIKNEKSGYSNSTIITSIK